MVGFFDTSDGSNLDANCILTYMSAAEQKTSWMADELNEAIVSSFCGAGVSTVIAHTQSFAGMGNQVSWQKEYLGYRVHLGDLKLEAGSPENVVT